MQNDRYELIDLIEEANGLRERTPTLADTPPFTVRNFHYYVKMGLLPQRGGRRGRNTVYPANLIYTLLFIRRLQTVGSLSLANIRDAIEQTCEESLEKIALGKEPFVWGYDGQFTERELKHYAEQGQVIKVRQAQRGKKPHRTFPVGPDARLIVSKKITPQQVKQLSHVVALAKGILEGSGEDQ